MSLPNIVNRFIAGISSGATLTSGSVTFPSGGNIDATGVAMPAASLLQHQSAQCHARHRGQHGCLTVINGRHQFYARGVSHVWDGRASQGGTYFSACMLHRGPDQLRAHRCNGDCVSSAQNRVDGWHGHQWKLHG